MNSALAPPRVSADERPLPWNLEDPNDKLALDRKFHKDINQDRLVQSKYWAEWNEVDRRLNSWSTPAGWTHDFSGALAKMNDPRMSAEEKEKILEFVSVNRTRPNHEASVGDFVALSRKLEITADNPTDRNRAKVFQKRVHYIERTEMLPQKVYFPAIDGAWSKGIHWVNVGYNPLSKGLKGRFEIEEVNGRDVLIDNQAKGAFYHKSRRFTQRLKLDVDEANAMFRKYPAYTPVGGDTEYDEAYGHNTDAIQASEFATFFRIHFHQREQHYYRVDLQTGDLTSIKAEEYFAAEKDPSQSQQVIMGEEEDAWYIALYHRAQGVFSINYNPIGESLLIPLVNIQSDGRLYPFGDVIIYANLQDLLDTLVTVFLKNAKKQNQPIGEADEEAWESYEESIKSAFRNGGISPGIKNVWNHQPLNQHLVMLVPWVIGWIQDTVSKHPATMGDLPAKQIAKETVQMLQAQDRTSQGRKDVCLSYALTRLAAVVCKFIAQFEKDPNFFPLTDAQAGSPSYIPMNQVWTEEAYMSNLATISELPPPEPPDLDAMPDEMRDQAVTQYQQAQRTFDASLMKAKKKFEGENDVKQDMQPGYIVGQREFTKDDILALMSNSGLTPEQFAQTYRPQQQMIRVFMVNMMEDDPELSITYSVGDDREDTPEFKANKAIMMKKFNSISTLDFIKIMGYPDADEMYDRVMDENQALQMMLKVVADPQLLAQVQQVIQSAEMNGTTSQ